MSTARFSTVSRQKDRGLRRETAYHVSTAALSAADAAHAVRAHWGIENRLHDVRDVTLGEDASRIRRDLGLFALPRSFALNPLRFNGVSNISLALYDKTLNFDRLLGLPRALALNSPGGIPKASPAACPSKLRVNR